MLNAVFKSALTSNTATALDPLGALRFEYDTTNGGYKVYKYVQAASDTTVANGTALAIVNLYGWQVTSDISDANQNQPAGVGIGAITASYYGWIQVGGYHSAIKTDAGDDIADGGSLILHATTDGVVDTTASGTAAVCKPIGIAVAADDDTADTVAGMICCVF